MERQTLHKLIRPSYDASGTLKRPPIFMAYDLKQSPRDAFTQYEVADNNLFGPSSGLQNSELIKLSKVFRYTPEIASFLEDLDASFPAIDIPGEWDAYAGEAQLESGVRPTLTVYPDDRALFRNIFQKAETLSRRFGGDGRGVAVLCLNDELFDVYARAAAGQFSGRIVIISGRDGMSALRHAGKRFVFSMPEYVAGLQFDTVFLVHVDMAEATADATIGIRRRFVSNVYLGASRAERVLELASSVSRGGPSSVLELALTRGTLVNG
jgi:hypothetical protein